jgi:hypothetical protein
MKLQIQKDNFVQFLEAIQKVNDSFILDLQDDNKASVIAMTVDETCFLYGKTSFSECSEAVLNIPDTKKLLRAVKFIDEDLFVLKMTSNALKYTSKQTRFTYHLFDDNFLKRPKIKKDKIEAFDFDVEIELKRDVIKTLQKNASFVDQANKLYLYTENSCLYGEITDKQRANTDNISMVIAENIDDTVPEIIIKLDNVQMLHLCHDDVVLRINTRLGLLAFEIISGLNKFMYILTSLKQ